MSENRILKPEVIVFSGTNGSGKTTITNMARTVGDYINADDIKRTTLCTDIEAALKAEELRNAAIKSTRILHLKLFYKLTEISIYCSLPKKKGTLFVQYMF